MSGYVMLCKFISAYFILVHVSSGEVSLDHVKSE